MRAWRLAGVAAVVAAGVAVGCSNNPPPIQEAKRLGGDGPKPETVVEPAAKPGTSAPAAAAVVAAAVAAHTGGKPELLKSLKAVTFARSGPAAIGRADPVPQTWTIDAVWPDKFRVRAEVPNQPAVTLGWTGTTGWRHVQGPGRMPMSAREVKDFQVDVTGDWLTLLFPLAEPELIVAPAADVAVNGKPAAGVRVWHPALSDAVLHFDKETKLLAQVAFDGRENGNKVPKEIRVAGSRPFAGVTIPAQTVVRLNGNVLAEWTITNLLPKPDMDAKLFENP